MVEALKPKYENATYSSFKIGIPSNFADIVIDPSFWPTNVFVNRFYKSNGRNFQDQRPNRQNS